MKFFNLMIAQSFLGILEVPRNRLEFLVYEGMLDVVFA